MGHVEDRWYRTVKLPEGGTQRVKTARFGKGNRYRVRYITPDGKERSESFPDRAKRDAEAFLVSVESDKLRGSYVDPAAGRITFGEYADHWLRTRGFDESTRETVGYRIRKHVLPFFGKRQLGAIRPGTIREWDRSLVGVLAVSTRSVIFAHVRSILAAAVDDGKIPKNPCSARSVQQPRPVDRKVMPWTVDEVTAIQAGLAPRYRAMVDLGAGCGLRQGEVFGIGVEDLDLDGGWVHVRRQLKRVRSKLVYGLPKSDRERRVPLSSTGAAALRAHMDSCSPVKVTLPWEDPDSDDRVTVALVFTSTQRHPINRHTFDERTWKPAVRAAGLVVSRDSGMHALRHFYASALLHAGESIKAVSAYLGHADPGFTLRVYTHLMPASEDRTRKAIDRVWGGEAGPDGPTTAQTAD